jgi:hypothetical protein
MRKREAAPGAGDPGAANSRDDEIEITASTKRRGEYKQHLDRRIKRFRPRMPKGLRRDLRK